jgi:curved DNA-binding protein CbpA
MGLDSYDPELDYYSLLDVSPSAAADEVKRAFYRAIRKVHPDLNSGHAGSTEQTQRINRAKILLNVEQRLEYDRLRADYWSAQPKRPVRPKRPAKRKRRARRRSAPRRSQSAEVEALDRLAMAFLHWLMREG